MIEIANLGTTDNLRSLRIILRGMEMGVEEMEAMEGGETKEEVVIVEAEIVLEQHLVNQKCQNNQRRINKLFQ